MPKTQIRFKKTYLFMIDERFEYIHIFLIMLQIAAQTAKIRSYVSIKILWHTCMPMHKMQ